MKHKLFADSENITRSLSLQPEKHFNDGLKSILAGGKKLFAIMLIEQCTLFCLLLCSRQNHYTKRRQQRGSM